MGGGVDKREGGIGVGSSCPPLLSKRTNDFSRFPLSIFQLSFFWLRTFRDGYLSVFHIPPDFDDTFVNLGLGSLLVDLSHDFPEALARWQRDNTNLTSLLDALRRYAYRPFGQNPDLSSIDPRTYYYIRYFLNEAHAAGQDVALVPTWVGPL